MGMNFTFKDEQHANAFETAFYAEYNASDDLGCIIEASENPILVFVGTGEGELGDGDASDIPAPRRHAINALAKQFGGRWDDEPTVESVAQELSCLDVKTEQQIRQIFADSGLPEADQRLAFEHAKEMIQAKRTMLEQTDQLLHTLRRFQNDTVN
jgi:hypothetical protein